MYDSDWFVSEYTRFIGYGTLRIKFHNDVYDWNFTSIDGAVYMNYGFKSLELVQKDAMRFYSKWEEKQPNHGR